MKNNAEFLNKRSIRKVHLYFFCFKLYLWTKSSSSIYFACGWVFVIMNGNRKWFNTLRSKQIHHKEIDGHSDATAIDQPERARCLREAGHYAHTRFNNNFFPVVLAPPFQIPSYPRKNPENNKTNCVTLTQSAIQKNNISVCQD